MPRPDLDSVLQSLPGMATALHELRERILANAILVGEIPAPTAGEERRIRFLCDRFTECGLQNIAVDQMGNAQAVLRGKGDGRRNLLVGAHADTLAPAGDDPAVTVGASTLTGPGMADNSLGLAIVATLPEILQHLGVELECDLILLGATGSLGRGDLGGLRFFLDHVKRPLEAGVFVEGVQIGRLSYSCLGMVRGEITLHSDAPADAWQGTGGGGALVNLNQVLTRILAIPVPQVPKTRVILGSARAGGAFFGTVPRKAVLRFEVRSEEVGVSRRFRQQVEEILEEVSAETGTENTLEVIAGRRPGGVPFSHPFVQGTRAVMDALGIRPMVAPSVGDLSALIAKEIPGVTLGITRGERVEDGVETVEIEPLFQGVAQLVGTLQMIDREVAAGGCSGGPEAGEPGAATGATRPA